MHAAEIRAALQPKAARKAAPDFVLLDASGKPGFGQWQSPSFNRKAQFGRSTPVTYLIDKRGYIAAKYVGIVDRSNVEMNTKALVTER